jgi:hypothetical protein
MKRLHRDRLALFGSALAVCLAAPASAHAQIGIRLVAGNSYPPQQIPLVGFLTDRTSIHADSRSGTESHVPVVLFVARVSNGKVMEQGRTDAFRLNLEAASSSSGLRLGSVVSHEQLLSLAPVARFGRATVLRHAMTREPVSAAELLARSSIILAAVQAAFDDLRNDESVLVIAVVPANENLRSRSNAGLLFVTSSVAGSELDEAPNSRSRQWENEPDD